MVYSITTVINIKTLLWFCFDPVSHLKSTLLWKNGKIRNSDHTYYYSATINQKSIQWHRLQINVTVSIQPKYCIEMKKLEHWIKLSKTHYLTRASPYNQSTENVKDWADRPLTFSQMQQSSSDETKQKQFGLLMLHGSHYFLGLSFKR